MANEKKSEKRADDGAPDPEAQETLSKMDAMLDDARSAYDRARSEFDAASRKLREEWEEFDPRQVGASAKKWVQDHPGAALLIALGAGVLLGRALSFRPAAPRSRWQRLRGDAARLTGEARRYADDAVDRVAHSLGETANQLRTLGKRAGREAAARVERLAEEAGSRGAQGTRLAQSAIGAAIDSAERAASHAAVARRAARRLRDGTVWKQTVHALIGAVAFKKIADWIKERY
jgi:hypothetical protein